MEEKKENLKELLSSLNAKFEENALSYHSPQYNEENARSDFIDEFFRLLGWDINNSEGFSEQYREVVREERVKVNGGQKAPDYSFRLGGTRVFFVEAKKPSVDIKKAAEPAFQLRRYGYSAKLAISILTNFEEFAVYDTRIKPEKSDEASVARIFYCSYQDYVKHFDFLYDTFSKTAILKGRLDRFVQENKHKKGTSEVDAELLKTLESWREDLARNISLRNPTLKVYELNLAVQKIVDRIIFLRIAEDKGIEEYGTLRNACGHCGHLRRYSGKNNTQSTTSTFPVIFDPVPCIHSTCFVQESDNSGKESKPEIPKSSFTYSEIYSELVSLFNRANTKYNSGLFATLPYLDALTIDDAVLKRLIEGLYYPDCPYEFSILPVEILGSIYEQFLGKTIRFRRIKGEKHTAIIEEKPEVKKAGGVYYTPEYIVKYIVERTVGRLLDERMSAKPEATLDEVLHNLRIVDPSCGSGSFLVGAYSYLLKVALDYYSEETHSKKALKEGKIYGAIGGGYKLSIETKQDILLSCIFGVDIDEQAVEVAKLSLYLKLLEDEGAEANSRQELFRHTDFALLPSLMNNIQCGNALVGKDYYLTCEEELFSDIEKKREINVFDWEERFASVFANGGFDCVIGNPPYVSDRNQVATEKLRLQRNYLAMCRKYKSLYQKWDLYIPFIEKGLNILKDGGLYGAIVPYPFTNQAYASFMREMILKEYHLLEIADLKTAKIFKDAEVINCIPIICKDNKHVKEAVAITHIDNENSIKVVFKKEMTEFVVDKKTCMWNLCFKTLDNSKHQDLYTLGDFCYISKGMVLNSDENTAKGQFVKADLICKECDDIHCKKYIEGKDLNKYSITRVRYLEYGTKRSPSQLSRPTFEALYTSHKLLINALGELKVSIDIGERYYCEQSVRLAVLWKDLQGVENKSITGSVTRYSHHTRQEMEELSEQVNLYYLLAILNSTYASHLLEVHRAGSLAIVPEHIRSLPIPIAPAKEMEELTVLAKEQLNSAVLLKEARLDSDRSCILSAISSFDAKIDEIVYSIYGVKEDKNIQ